MEYIFIANLFGLNLLKTVLMFILPNKDHWLIMEYTFIKPIWRQNVGTIFYKFGQT
jgi:hypothetical protein